MYCSIEDVKRYDYNDITEDVNDDELLIHIDMGSAEIDYYCKRTFDVNAVPSSVMKANALLAILFLDRTYNAFTNAQIKREKIQEIETEYFQSNSEDTSERIPLSITRLLDPYVKQNKSFFVKEG